MLGDGAGDDRVFARFLLVDAEGRPDAERGFREGSAKARRCRAGGVRGTAFHRNRTSNARDRVRNTPHHDATPSTTRQDTGVQSNTAGLSVG